MKPAALSGCLNRYVLGLEHTWQKNPSYTNMVIFKIIS